MQFRILGSLEVVDRDKLMPVGGMRQRTLLAVLLLEVDQVVAVHRLVDAVWDLDPPATARDQVRNGVSALRGIVNKESGSRIVTEDGGYRLRLGSGTVDLHQFNEHVNAASAATADLDLDRAVHGLRAALALWRGPALAGIPSSVVRDVAAGLDERRLVVLEDRIELDLVLGRHRDVLGELTAMVAQHPGRHRLTGQLMRALHAAGRPGDALKTYRQAKRWLAEELGLEPPAELAQLELSILRDEHTESSLYGVSPSRVIAIQSTRAAQLPADLATFTGRDSELDEILMHAAGDQNTYAERAVAVCALDGTAGIGKTALAVHAAHRLVDQFPDRQLFVDLHGFTPGIEPVEPGRVLERFLLSLGMPASRIPTDLDARAALYRSTLAGQRMLVVFDNAADEAQVAPLLPASPGCLVLVTGRRRLTGLVHARPLTVDVLPPADAAALFTRVAGSQRLANDLPELLDEVTELCGRLPLAIHIAAARLRARPAWTLAHLAARLRDQRFRLAELSAVGSTLELSYRRLTGDQQRLFRLLGLHPGPDSDTQAAAALLNATGRKADGILEELVDAHLLEQPAANRYRLHDLVRTFAAAAAVNEDLDADRQAALRRLVDHYTHTTSAAVDAAYLHDRPQDLRPGRTTTPQTAFVNTVDQAVTWLDTELANLLAAAAYAATNRWRSHVINLSAALHHHLRTRGRYSDALTLHRHALTAATAAHDQEGELSARRCLGHTLLIRGQYQLAGEHLDRALTIARAIGHPAGEIIALRGLGNIHYLQGRHPMARTYLEQALTKAQAAADQNNELDTLSGLAAVDIVQGQYQLAGEHLDRALTIARAIGHPAGEIIALRGLGNIHYLQGRHPMARTYLEQALTKAQAAADQNGELYALNVLGAVDIVQGQYQLAGEHLDRALTIARTAGHRVGQLDALIGLGNLQRRMDHHTSSVGYFHQALDLARAIGDRAHEVEALHGLGLAHHVAGSPSNAINHHRQALDIASKLNQPLELARAHDGLAYALRSLGHIRHARKHWQQALTIFTDIGAAQARQVQSQLQDIDSDLPPDDPV